MRSIPRRFFKVFLLATSVLTVAGAAGAVMTGARAQGLGVHQYTLPGGSGPSSYGTSTGGPVQSGTAVSTGHVSPLNQPIPPAASSFYTRQLGRAATPTSPSPFPFGTQ